MKKPPLQVLHVCAEIFPFLKTGGLADVTAALPAALRKLQCDVRMLVPGFPAFMHHIQEQHLVAEFPGRLGAYTVRLLFGTLPDTNIPVYIVDAPGLFDRIGNPYVDIHNQPYPDNHRRFAMLGWMAARIVDGIDFYWRPQVVHGHDWHAGLAFAYIKSLEQHRGKKLVGTMCTIHNMAYQGNFPEHIYADLDLPSSFFEMEGLEFYGQVSFLKAGLAYADKITTVSPTYANEIQGWEQGCGLDGIIRKRVDDLHGILNGVDRHVWNPSTDKVIAVNYNARSISGKKRCKSALQQEMGLTEQNGRPVFCVVSRFAAQKGLHLLLECLPYLLDQGGQVVIIGNGEYSLEQGFLEYAHHYPQQVAVRIGYDEQIAHRVIAGSDVIMVPSRYEPCGLTQIYGLLYGTLPLVHRIGGLADTVVDSSPENRENGTATGFTFDYFDGYSFEGAIHRAFELYGSRKKWLKVQRQGMKQRFDWKKSAREYKSLYEKIKVVTSD